MYRNTKFHSLSHQPHQGRRSLQLLQSQVNGPVLYLNPTKARFAYDKSEVSPTVPSAHPTCPEAPAMTGVKKNLKDQHTQPQRRARDISFEWRSRDNRKGRSLLIVHLPGKEAEDEDSRFLVPQSTASVHHILRNIRLMFTYFPYWDISYLVAFIFTFGSVVWVINGCFAWLPLQDPESEFKYEGLFGVGVTAFIGATLFEFGSVLLVLESVNVNQEGCFGWAVEAALQGNGEMGKSDGQLKVTAKRDERDHHYNRNCLLKELNRPTPPTSLSSYSLDSPERQSWQWLPSFHDLRTHLLHELGFLASVSQLIGATIFWISGFTALPGIHNKMSQGLLDGIYWTPQIVGGSGFIVSSTLFMLETQQNWYTPAPRSLGWHVGLWNLVGAFGFTICGALGLIYGSSGSQYQAALATFWGSWSFLIASVIQWYESLGKWVVEHVTD
ncbi:uncharacterized protein V1513DRAFT_460857 [Lipomyces chichibuensis]|uniref:uncharacterized protein n=1 Tax=Lipomyces chichibuensis TaxID=1546026 RepID=UPI003343C12D